MIFAAGQNVNRVIVSALPPGMIRGAASRARWQAAVPRRPARGGRLRVQSQAQDCCEGFVWAMPGFCFRPVCRAFRPSRFRL